MASEFILTRGAIVLAALLVGEAASAAPTAAERETARSLMAEGDRRLAEHDAAAAVEAYGSADAIMHVPTTALALARAQIALGHWVEAADALARARRPTHDPEEPEVMAAARREAARLDAELAPRIPTIAVVVLPPTASPTVTIDGVPLEGQAARQPRRVNPGAHEVQVSAAGFIPQSTSTRVAEGKHQRLELALEPLATEPAPSPSPSFSAEAEATPTEEPTTSRDHDALRIATWVGFGIGGAGLLVGTVAGVVVLRRTADLEARCGGTACPASEAEAHATTETIANVSNVGLALGLAGVGAGLTTLLLDLSAPADEVAVTPFVSPTMVGLTGRLR